MAFDPARGSGGGGYRLRIYASKLNVTKRQSSFESTSAQPYSTEMRDKHSLDDVVGGLGYRAGRDMAYGSKPSFHVLPFYQQTFVVLPF